MKKIGILVLIFLLLISTYALANSEEDLEKAGLREVKVYFVESDEKVTETEFVPLTYLTKKGDIEKIMKSAIVTLLQGLTEDQRKEFNLETFIPEGTRLINLDLDENEGIVSANFSKELQNYGGGSTIARLIEGQIRMTLTQFKIVKQIIITVEGKGEKDGVLQP